MTEPLVPNPNMRPPGIKPASTDDYTMKEGDVENIPMDSPLHPAYKDTTATQRFGIKVAGIGGNIERAYDEAVKFANEYKFGEADSTEDTFRHILLGGLVDGMGEKDPLQKRLFKGFAGKRIDAREDNDPESKIDLVNNKFGRILREAVPNEEEFVKAAKDVALLMRSNDTREVKQDKLKQRYGVEELPINSLDAYERLRSDEFNELPYEMRQSELVSRYKVDPRDAARILVKEPDPMKSTDDYTKREGGALMAQTGVMPMSKAQDDPTGGGPKVAKGRKQTKKPKVQRGLARPMVDPRDEAMKEITQASQQKGSVLPTTQPSVMQAAKGVTAITVGIGAKPDLMKAEKGEPPMGATKKEVADDQHVMMSEGELVVPANVVRYHGLGTYENMRQEALMGLESMEDAGQIEYVGDEKTSKTNDGGLLTAQSGLALGSGPTAASAQFAGLSSSPTTSVAPLSLGRPILDKDGNIIGYEPNTQPTPTQTSGVGLVAPNVGSYETSVKEDFTKPPEGVETPTSPSGGIGEGSGGGGSGFTPAQPRQTSQDYMESFDKNVDALSAGAPTDAMAFQKSDFDDYLKVRQPMSEREGIMGKVGGAVDSAAGYILPFTGYQDQRIRETAANRIKNKQYRSLDEYNSLVNTINLSPLGGEDEGKLAGLITEVKGIAAKEGFDDKAAEAFSKASEEAAKKVDERMNQPVIFKERTAVDNFLDPQPSQEARATREREKKLLSGISPDSVGGSGGLTKEEIRDLDAKRASDAYNESLRKERDARLERDSNPYRMAERMRAEVGGGDTSQMSGAERDVERQRREESERQAAEFDRFQQRERARQKEDEIDRQQGNAPGTSRGTEGGTPTAFEEGGALNCVIATHGLSTGGFTRLEKAKAEIWCGKKYHGKWYGEAFRRGYRDRGQRYINAGQAQEHYQEFKDFVAYGRGVKKGFGLAINYYLRTIQFFITGLFISEK